MIDQHNSLAEKFLKKGFWLYLFSFIIAPIGYIVKIIVSNELEVSEVGIIYGVLSLMILVSSFNDLGMAESLNKFIPEYITKKEYSKVKTILLYAILAQIITGIIIFCFFYFGSQFLAENYFKDSKSLEVIKVFSFYFLASNFFHVTSVFFLAVQNTFLQKIIESFRMFFILIFTICIFVLDLGSIITYSYSWVLGMFFGVFVSLFFFYTRYFVVYLKNEKVIFDKILFKNIFKYALLVFLGAQAGTILSQIDMQMIIYMLGNTDAGYFTNYLSIIGIPFMIIGPIFGLLFPIFSEMNAKGEIDKIKMVKQVFTKNFLSFSIAFSILFFVFGQVISTILFGEKFLTSGIILQYSILFLSFNFLLQINFNIFAAIGQVKERLYIILVAIVFNTILNYIFIKLFGVGGAALATGFGWALIWLLSETKLKEYRVGFDFKYLLKNTFIFSIFGIFLYFFIIPFFGSDRIYNLFLLCFISLIYFIIFFAINLNDYKYLITEIKNLRKKS